MSDIRSHILLQADVLFTQYGIKSITMDDIAKQLGMSKKTIYQHFNDKHDLVLELMRSKMEEHKVLIEECCKTADNAIHELFFGLGTLEEMLSKTNPTMFYDLQKFFPEAWAHFKDFREQVLLTIVKNNLNRGIEEQLFRPDIDIEVLSRMRLEAIEMNFNPTIFPTQKFSIARVARVLTLHFIYGLCTPKGFELAKKYEQKN